MFWKFAFGSIFPSLYYPLLSFSSLSRFTLPLLPLSVFSLSQGAWLLVGVLLNAVVKGAAGLYSSACVKVLLSRTAADSVQLLFCTWKTKIMWTNAFPILLGYCNIFHTSSEEGIITMWQAYFILISEKFKTLLQLNEWIKNAPGHICCIRDILIFMYEIWVESRLSLQYPFELKMCILQPQIKTIYWLLILKMKVLQAMLMMIWKTKAAREN